MLIFCAQYFSSFLCVSWGWTLLHFFDRMCVKCSPTLTLFLHAFEYNTSHLLRHRTGRHLRSVQQDCYIVLALPNAEICYLRCSAVGMTCLKCVDADVMINSSPVDHVVSVICCNHLYVHVWHCSRLCLVNLLCVFAHWLNVWQS